jgi:hypothetical protein
MFPALAEFFRLLKFHLGPIGGMGKIHFGQIFTRRREFQF